MATILSKADDERVKSLQSQWQERKLAGADTGILDAIHSQAESIRNQYGYSGGASGNEIKPIVNASNGVNSPTNYAPTGSQSDYLNQLYSQKQTAALNSLKSVYDQNVASLNASAAKIPETYYTARNQTAATSAQNQSAFNERAVASGLNSGAGGQAALAMGNTLTSNIGALNKQEASSLADIETQRAKLASQYQSQIASAVSDNNIALAQALYNESVRAQNQQIDNQRYQDTLTANNLATEKAEYGNNIMAYYGDYQAEINNVLNNNDPTDDWKAQILQAARNQKLLDLEEKAAKATKTYSGGGSGGGDSGGGKPKLTAAQALAAYEESGIRTPEVIAAYTYYYGDPNYDPDAQPPYSTPRTATYGNSTVADVNDKLNNGYTPQEVMAAARIKYGANSKKYQDIVDAVLRK